MTFEPTGLPGCVLIHYRVTADERGRFAKTFHAPDYAQSGLRSDWGEEIHTTSAQGVVRGMHFQVPPEAQAKLVCCVAGEVLDVVVDLRRGSPTYKQHRSFTLSASNGAALYIPGGLAHGFASLKPDSTMFYKITGTYTAECDAGIAWDSFGFSWPAGYPLMSERDRRHPALDEYETPFVYDADRPSQ